MTDQELDEIEKLARSGMATEDPGADWSGKDILQLAAEVRRRSALLADLIQQTEGSGYECEAGPLELLIAWRNAAELVKAPPPNASE